LDRPALPLARLAALGALLVAGLAAAPAAQAQPFESWLVFHAGYPSSHGFAVIPHHPSLNPTGDLTIEAWVKLAAIPPGDCRSIAGKGYHQAWWLGLCNIGGTPTFRSYLRGDGSAYSRGEIEPGVWTHLAVTYDGTKTCHYINGELAGCRSQGAPTVSPASVEVRIGSDEHYEFTPVGAIDEVRIWNVARTLAQIRDGLKRAFSSAQPGLVAVWSLDAHVDDEIGARDGDLAGSNVGFLNFPVTTGCTTSATVLCLHGRFAITTRWRTNPVAGSATDGSGSVVPSTNVGSGLFWFFSANNWEILVKALNGCGLNNRHWTFSASTTNVYYRMEVLDTVRGAQRIFFNYPGPPAPAVTDTNAFATCP
jgi:hypothetical protein